MRRWTTSPFFVAARAQLIQPGPGSSVSFSGAGAGRISLDGATLDIPAGALGTGRVVLARANFFPPLPYGGASPLQSALYIDTGNVRPYPPLRLTVTYDPSRLAPTIQHACPVLFDAQSHAYCPTVFGSGPEIFVSLARAAPWGSWGGIAEPTANQGNCCGYSGLGGSVSAQVDGSAFFLIFQPRVFCMACPQSADGGTIGGDSPDAGLGPPLCPCGFDYEGITGGCNVHLGPATCP